MDPLCLLSRIISAIIWVTSHMISWNWRRLFGIIDKYFSWSLDFVFRVTVKFLLSFLQIHSRHLHGAILRCRIRRCSMMILASCQRWKPVPPAFVVEISNEVRYQWSERRQKLWKGLWVRNHFFAFYLKKKKKNQASIKRCRKESTIKKKK